MLDGKVAVVTGGTRGIGFATVEKFLENGAKVFLLGSKKESVDNAINTLKNINLNIFKNHDIKLLYSNGYSKSKYALILSLTLGYFTKKIEEYEKAMLKYVTPQHYIEHVNAIGHLDKIIILSKSEAKIIEGCLNQNIPGDICDFMGMFIPGINEIVAKELSSLINEKVNKKETAILLCPENMWQMMSLLKNNKPTLMEMVDKVFSHEIGHLAFYFYYSKLGYAIDEASERAKNANIFANF